MTQRTMILAVAVILLAAYVGSRVRGVAKPKASEPSAKQPRILLQLDGKLPDAKFDDVPLGDVVNFFRNATGMKIKVKWTLLEAAGISRKVPVTARLFNVRTDKALRVIMDSVSSPQAKLHLETDIANDQIVLTTYSDYVARNTYVREYDIRDLLARWRARGTSSGATLCDDITMLIEETVAPDSWVTEGDFPGAIKAVGGRLFITQTRENHRQIDNLMEQLRETAFPPSEVPTFGNPL